MDARQFLPIIRKTLAEAQGGRAKFGSVDELANMIVGKMQDFEEMVSLAFQVDAAPPPAAQNINVFAKTLGLPPEPGPEPTPATQTVRLPSVTDRIDVTEERRYSEREITALKSEAVRYLTANLPATILAEAEGFKDGLKLHRTVKMMPGDLPSVKVFYAPAGSDPETGGVGTLVVVGETMRSAEDVLKELKTASRNFTPTQRRVEPRRPTGPASVDAMFRDLSSIPGTSADEASAEDMNRWGHSAPLILGE